MIQIIVVLAVMIAVPAMVGGNSIASATTTISLDDLTCDPSGTVTAEVMLKDVQNYGTGTMNITYNPYVVHVTGVTGNTNSTVITHNEDNTAGVVTISAWNTGGVSGDIEFASVTFEAVGTGSTLLGLGVTKLRDTSMTTPIPFEIANGSITISGGNGGTEPQLPFVITGHVSDSNGDPCNNSWVQVTNATGESWDAENDSASNYYRLVLGSDDVNAGEILHFNVTDGTSTNSTDHTMTDDEVNAGGLFDFNLTLESSVDPAPYLVVYTISNTTISPNGDGIKDDTEIYVEFSESVAAAIRIENATGIVKELYTSSSVMNPNPKTWDGTDNSSNTVSTGTYQVNVTMYDGVNPVVYNNTRSIEVTCADTTPPASITDPQNTTYEETYINWTWTDPDDVDFSHVMVYLDETLATNVTKGVQCYSAAGLNPDTEHVIGTRTVDQSGNVNEIWVNHTAWTKPSPVPVIVSIGSAEGSVGDSVDVSINITNASSIGAMDIRVAYNASILYATNVANGSLIESLPAPIVAYHLGYMSINISFATFPETIDGDGELFIVAFDLIDGEAGGSSTLEIAAEAYKGSVPIVEVPVTTVNGVITVTGVPDTTPPAITDVANETPTSSSVTITWTTNEASDSLVKYGIDSDNYMAEAFDATMTTSHAVQLSGLDPNMTYYFVVNSTDASNDWAESSEYSFVTAAESQNSDLTVTLIETPANLRNDVINPITATVTNIGASGASSFDVSLEANGTTIDTTTITSLAAGENTTVELLWTPDTTGSAMLTVTADANDALTESDETNNNLSETVDVLEKLTVTANVRVEGKNDTVWVGDVTFSNSTVTATDGSVHYLNEPTALGALDEANKTAGFDSLAETSAYGRYISEINNEPPIDWDGWMYCVNYASPWVGAADYTLTDSDKVLWYFGAWTAPPLKIELDRTTVVMTGETFVATVTAYNDSTAAFDTVEAAEVYVDGTLYGLTGLDGTLTMSLAVGDYQIHADKGTWADYTRSEKVDLTVTPTSTATYDFMTGAGRDRWAYRYQTDAKPSAANDVPDIEFMSNTKPNKDQYVKISTDNHKMQSDSTDAIGNYSAHRFVFDIMQPVEDILTIEVLWNGKGTNTNRTVLQGATLYIWNSTGYEELASTTSNKKVDLSAELTEGFGNYIDADGYLTVLVEQNSAQSVKGKRSLVSKLSTDYVKVGITHR